MTFTIDNDNNLTAHGTAGLLLGCAQPLDALPDAGRGGLVALEALHGRDARQAVPDRDQPFRRPGLGPFR